MAFLYCCESAGSSDGAHLASNTNALASVLHSGDAALIDMVHICSLFSTEVHADGKGKCLNQATIITGLLCKER